MKFLTCALLVNIQFHPYVKIVSLSLLTVLTQHSESVWYKAQGYKSTYG